MLDTTQGQAILRPAEVEDLFVQPVLADSIAGRACTVLRTNSKWVTIPMMTKGPTAAWVAELAEIPTSDATFESLTITPAKVAGLVPMSNELRHDSLGDAAAFIGARLTLETVRALDLAFLTSVPSPAPQGLATLPVTPSQPTSVTVVKGGTDAFKTLDLFVQAAANADDRQAPITSWIMHPTTRAALATIKTANGANTYLMPSNTGQPSVRTLEGATVFTASSVPANTVWGIPSSRCLMVIREDVRVERSEHANWSRDGVSIRSVMRVGFGFTDPSAIVKITTDAP